MSDRPRLQFNRASLFTVLAAIAFALVALSAFTTQVNVNELGFLGLGLFLFVLA